MRQKHIIAIILLLVIMGVCRTNSVASNNNEEITGRYFDAIKFKKDNAQLTLFFSLMPKGGDIHHHYSGALYAETYLDWASRKNLCIDSKTLKLNTCSGNCSSCISIDSLKKNGALYRTVLEEWSDLDYSNHFHLQDQPDQHFFKSFFYFGTISGSYYRPGLADIKSRAQRENVQYIETMLTSPNIQVKFQKNLNDSLIYYQSKKDTAKLINIFNYFAAVIKSSSNYNSDIKNYIDSLHSYHKGIDDSSFTMRFQAYAFRNSSPDVVFTILYSCFDAVTRDNSTLIVGVNILGPENGIVAMRDYWMHMLMFRFLKKQFPTVKTSMHAGELAMGLVKPEDLTYHIYDAVFIAGACRIGHGVDLPYETKSFELLSRMKEKKIPVEINLTSNEFILGVKNNDHPISIYFNAGVPLVISTDDAGVSRNNLTTEYVKLASRYDFTYKQIKAFVINSIKYSFLNDSEKKSILDNLYKRFNTFEAKIASEQGRLLK